MNVIIFFAVMIGAIGLIGYTIYQRKKNQPYRKDGLVFRLNKPLESESWIFDIFDAAKKAAISENIKEIFEPEVNCLLIRDPEEKVLFAQVKFSWKNQLHWIEKPRDPRGVIGASDRFRKIFALAMFFEKDGADMRQICIEELAHFWPNARDGTKELKRVMDLIDFYWIK